MQSTSPSTTPSIEDLERQKLALEVGQLSAPWWRRPTLVLAALPTVLAIFTVAYGFANGYFQALSTKLENQRHDLEAEVKQFSEQKHDLQVEIKKLQQQVDNDRDALDMRAKDAAYRIFMYKEAKDRIVLLEEELSKRGISVPEKASK